MAIEELERAAILVDRPEAGLRAGDVGVVVHVMAQGQGYLLEFFNGTGDTLAVEPFAPGEVAPLRPDQILHVRPLAAA